MTQRDQVVHRAPDILGRTRSLSALGYRLDRYLTT